MTNTERILLVARQTLMHTALIHEQLLKAAAGPDAVVDQHLTKAILTTQAMLENLRDAQSNHGFRSRQRVAG